MKKIISHVMALIIAICIFVSPAYAVEYSPSPVKGAYTDGINTYFGQVPYALLNEEQKTFFNEFEKSTKSFIMIYKPVSGQNYFLYLYSVPNNAVVTTSVNGNYYKVSSNVPISMLSFNKIINTDIDLHSSMWEFASFQTERLSYEFPIVGDNYRKIADRGLFTTASSNVFPQSAFIKSGVDYVGSINFDLYTDEEYSVDTAYNILSGNGNFTYEQSIANTQMDITKALQKSVNAISGLSETGVVIELEDIEITSFTPAMSGTESEPKGTNGSFVYSVTLQKGLFSRVLSGFTGSITANEYSTSPDRLAVTSAVSILNSNKTFAFEQKNVTDNTDLAKSLQNAIGSLSGFADTGVTATVTVGDYVPAITGDETNENGTDGSFTASVLLSKGTESETVSGLSGVLKASAYIPPEPPPEPPVVGDLAEMLEYFLKMVTSAFGVILPVGLVIAGIILGIRMIPRMLKQFTTGV